MKTIRVFILFSILLVVACNSFVPAPLGPPAMTTPTRALDRGVFTPVAAKPNTPIAFASGQLKTWSVAQDDAFVYWTDCGDNPAAKNGKVRRAPKSGGAPMTLASNESCPTTLALDADSVYYLVNDPQQSLSKNLKRVAKTGGAATTLVAGQDIRGLAVDDANVYWTTCDLSRNTGAALKVPKQSGAPMTIESSQGCFFDIAVDAANVYWIEERGILRVAKSGGAATMLAPAQFNPRQLVLDETHAYWIAGAYIMQIAKSGGAVNPLVAGQKDLGNLALDQANVYWNAAGALMKIGKSGGAMFNLASVNAPVHSLAVDQTNIFWTNLSGAVMKIEKAGGVLVETKSETTTLAIAQENINSFAHDDANAYWTTCRYGADRVGRGVVMRVSKQGGALTTLASDQICPKEIAVDATNVYWINEGRETAPGDYRDGAVMTVAKSGGAPVALASKQDGRARLAVDDANIYWTDCGTSARKGEDGAVFRIGKQGGAPPSTVAQGAIVSGQSCPGEIAADAMNVYWHSAGTLYKADKRGGAPIVLAANGDSAIILDDVNVFWARTEAASRTTYRSCADERSALYQVSKSGGTPVRLANLMGLPSSKLAMDATSIYWTNDCVGGIAKIPKVGGEPVPVLSNVYVKHVAVDATHIYWTASDGTVMKKAK